MNASIEAGSARLIYSTKGWGKKSGWCAFVNEIFLFRPQITFISIPLDSQVI